MKKRSILFHFTECELKVNISWSAENHAVESWSVVVVTTWNLLSAGIVKNVACQWWQRVVEAKLEAHNSVRSATVWRRELNSSENDFEAPGDTNRDVWEGGMLYISEESNNRTLHFMWVRDKMKFYKVSSISPLKYNSSSASKSNLPTTSLPSTIKQDHQLLSKLKHLLSLPKMIFPQALITLGALLALAPSTQAFTTPCIYLGYKCGYTMVTEFGMSLLLPSLSSIY